jgi:hypothetical protein
MAKDSWSGIRDSTLPVGCLGDLTALEFEDLLNWRCFWLSVPSQLSVMRCYVS